LNSLPVRVIASERGRKVLLLDDLLCRIVMVVLVVLVVVMEDMVYGVMCEKAM
jgi:hypothetical protein